MGRAGPVGLPSISVVPGRECLYTFFLPSFAAAPPAKPGELGLSSSISGEFLYGLAFCWRRLRIIQKTMPRSARASGIPTASPTIRPMLLLDLPEGGEFELAVLAVGSGDGVVMMVFSTVTTPAGPDDTLVRTEVTGVAEDTARVGVEAPDAGADDAGALVFEGELPLPEAVAKPVKDERVGALDAWFRPMVAYAFPSCSWKKGRGAGDSWQQLTCTASALQQKSLSWFEHCVMASPPEADPPVVCKHAACVGHLYTHTIGAHV
jgi:hypothetical protein